MPDFVVAFKRSAAVSGPCSWAVFTPRSSKDLSGIYERILQELQAQYVLGYVSDDPTVGVDWGYLLLSEDDIEAARGSWAALRKLGARMVW